MAYCSVSSSKLSYYGVRCFCSDCGRLVVVLSRGLSFLAEKCSEVLGGPGVVVEIDDMKFGRLNLLQVG